MRIPMIINGMVNVLAIGLLIYGLLLVFLYFYQGRMLFLPDIPSRSIDTTPLAAGLKFEPLNLETKDNIRIHGWFIPAPNERGVLLFFHGNAGNISHRLDSLLLFNKLGLSTLIFDYRGYGKSEGRPTEAGTYADAEAAWYYLVRSRSVAPSKIIFFGRSLGAGVAVHLASRHTPAALIVESAFTSVPDLAAELYPFLPARWLSRFKYNNHRKLRNIRCPVLVIHSRNDEIIPFSHGQSLYAIANSPKKFLELRGGHNDGFLISGKDYRQGLEDFLSTWIN